ncbi:hypothetical protein ACFYM0_02725 [Streptomyces sp. NPDC006487]|uniref:hypothetical protein n=1 Tax=Streptomyces sp. NPDC006487 TaxID=3364748 RepID=UPI0036C04F14
MTRPPPAAPTPPGKDLFGHPRGLAPRMYCSQMLGVWFLSVTAGDSDTGLLCMAHVNPDAMPAVAIEAAVATLAGLVVYLFRVPISRLMGTAA